MANNDAETSSRSISMSSGDIHVEVSDDVYSDDVCSDVVHSDVVIEDNCEGDDDDHGVSDDSKMIDAIVGCSEDVSRSNSSGYIEGDQSKEDNNFQELSTSNHLVKAGESKRHNPLSILAAKLFDETIPLKKKLKWLKRVATVKKDGTVQFEVPGDVKTPSLDLGTGMASDDPTEEEQLESGDIHDLPPLQIVMLIVGTRGDVQPFVAIGKRLQEYGHRVRLATHRNFKEFVLAAGLEFFPLGGDPKVLAGYMVKNKGFLPSEPSEIPIQRNQMRDIIFSLLPACQNPDPESQVPFTADAIIANPPAYGRDEFSAFESYKA